MCDMLAIRCPIRREVVTEHPGGTDRRYDGFEGTAAWTNSGGFIGTLESVEYMQQDLTTLVRDVERYSNNNKREK